MTGIHTRAEHDRAEAYRIRKAATIGNSIELRTTTGHLDAQAVAIESTLRTNANLPNWIRELDAPPEYRNPTPWPYCHNLNDCPDCVTALSVDLPPTTPIDTLNNAINNLIDAIIQPFQTIIERLIKHPKP